MHVDDCFKFKRHHTFERYNRNLVLNSNDYSQCYTVLDDTKKKIKKKNKNVLNNQIQTKLLSHYFHAEMIDNRQILAR